MEKLGLNEARERYLAFFEKKGHLRLPSFPLVPNNDPSLLLINSGMAPMKKFFTGEEEPPRNRVCTCQKCIRTPDLERVGHTARHGTFFEMLGNFSFGDYFKYEAIPWAWEFLTEDLQIPKELLWPSIYEEDEEAYDIWVNKVGVDPAHVVRLGKADNFWEHGSGPCGPCSEIYFDRGEKYGCGKPDCKPGCDCDRYMEIWNNVFSQFNNDGKGNYTELKQKNIDTGMGLERLACVLQGVDNMFEVDTIRTVLDNVCRIAGKTYGTDKENDISIRVITDHIRSATFMISDGVIPSNEGRGYVLRRILRRACRHGKLLGINRAFLVELAKIAIAQSEKAYPELAEKKEYILKVIAMEEERFDATLDAGLNILNNVIAETKKKGSSVMAGDDAFKLYDTFGFPIDLTREIAEEAGLTIDDDRFAELMQEQKIRAREARANISGWSNASKTILADMPKTKFVGYETLETKAKVLAILTEDMSVNEVSEGEFSVILDTTSFYGEGGGQVGDSGVMTVSGNTVQIVDTQKTDGVFIHSCRMENDTVLRVGDTVTVTVDGERRKAIMRNHSSVHLLQAALRKYLGAHVEQAGSYVDEFRGRFDFTHFEAVPADILQKVEDEVNRNILADLQNDIREMPIDEAKKLGAMALFGEKYGKIVRVVRMGDVSTEFCGGTHVQSTGKIGLFKILSESSVAAGVRRIEATTGLNLLHIIKEKQETIESVASTLKSSVSEVEKKAASLVSELKDTQRELESAKAKLALGATDGIVNSAEKAGKVQVAMAEVKGGLDELRSLGDALKDKKGDLVAMLHTTVGEKSTLLVVCGADAVKNGVKAGDLIKVATAVTGGGGGGKPDSAMGSIKDVSKLADAYSAVKKALEG